MAAVTFRHVWKHYGQVTAVRDLNLECEDHEFVCILGPSGCGKSSTLRMVAGLEFISEGEILFGEERVNDLEPRQRDIAMVHEAYALYPHKTVYQNIANPLMLRKMPKAEIDRRVRRAAEILDIGELLDRKPGQLSGGQRQRVGIGRAIVREPKVFLFDEPISHLDAKLRAHMRGELKRLQKELGTTMIYVTHDQLEGLSMAQKIAVMDKGVLQQVGTPTEIFESPVNAWVATFVGDPPMNLITAELQSENGTLYLVHPSFRVPLPERQRREVIAKDATSRKVRLGVRPDNIIVSATENGASIPASVYISEPLGEDTIVEFRVGGDRVVAKTRGAFDGRIDQGMFIEFDEAKLHVFDIETGLALG
jgi:multiple sugar transport system ATP-binding protein